MFIRFIIIFLIFVFNVAAEEISGSPKIIDGDTVHINNYKFRLEGIDAPEMRQQCKKESFKISFLIGLTFYKDYSCGRVSKEKLITKIDTTEIKIPRYAVGACFVKNARNINIGIKNQ